MYLFFDFILDVGCVRACVCVCVCCVYVVFWSDTGWIPVGVPHKVVGLYCVCARVCVLTRVLDF